MGVVNFTKNKCFDDKPKKINKKIALMKQKKHEEADKKLTDIKKLFHKYQQKYMIFCYAECILKVITVIKIFYFSTNA